MKQTKEKQTKHNKVDRDKLKASIKSKQKAKTNNEIVTKNG